ncbi:MAG TPA: condensation domain-containing protein, partial [Terriglobales bacterium]|nr:condensation domain-containing protein [Terriglobales bacterium]
MPESTGFQLSQQQKQLWLAGADENAFNSVIAVALDGAVNAAKLKDSLDQVVARHEALRTTFERRPGMRVPLQVVRATLVPAWEEIGSASASAVDQVFASEATAPFDLHNGPVVRAKLLNLADKKRVLVISTPTLCADVASLQNVVREIAAGYPGEAASDEVFQYPDFSSWQSELLQAEEDEDAKAAKQFWSELLAGTSIHRLPFEKQASGAFKPAT